MNSPRLPASPALPGHPSDTGGIDFAAVIRGAGDAIVTLDLQGRVTSWNPAAERLLGYSRAALIGLPAPHLLPAGQLPPAGRRVAQRLHRDRAHVDVVAHVAPIHDDHGAMVGWSEILRPRETPTDAIIADDAAIGRALAQALPNGELEVFYQPIFRLSDRHPVGAEALLRWQRSDDGLVLPDRFIRVAEDTGQIAEMGLFVMHSACSQIAQWNRDGDYGLPLSVNVSAHQFRSKDFATSFAAAIHQSGVDPRWLKLEITESALVEDQASASARLDELRALGVGIAIDDFGVGYSSLSRLRQYRIDTLKVDHSFVRDVASDAIAKEVVGAIVRLAHKLGMSVVAEGIETEPQFEALLDLGCDCGQGFLLARPMPASELAEQLRRLPPRG